MMIRTDILILFFGLQLVPDLAFAGGGTAPLTAGPVPWLVLFGLAGFRLFCCFMEGKGDFPPAEAERSD